MVEGIQNINIWENTWYGQCIMETTLTPCQFSLFCTNLETSLIFPSTMATKIKKNRKKRSGSTDNI